MWVSATSRARLAALFWFAGIAAAFVAFVLWNDPLRYAAIHFQPLLFAAIVLAACAGFGWIARAPDALTSAAIGCGILGTLSFAAALLHLLLPVTFIVILGAGIVLFAVWSAAACLRFQAAGVPAGSTAGIAILAVVVALILPFVLAPDVSTDGLEYHLLVPKLTIQQNAIRTQPLLVESNYPSLAEYDFIPMLMLSDERTAKAFHFLCAVLLLMAIGRLARANGALAAAMFFSMPIAALTSGWAWNDMLFTLFVVLSLVQILERRFVVAGVLFGFATWTKYTFVLAGIAVAAVLIRGAVQRWWRMRDLVRFAVPVLLIAAVWMTKNAVLTGNPVYPFLNGIFHSPLWSDVSDRYFRATLTHYEIPQWHWWTWLAFPLLLTLKARVIDVQTGILPLVLLPLLFVPGRDEKKSALRTYILAMVIAWLFIRTEARSLLSLFAVLTAVVAAEIDRLRGWRVVVAVAVAANLVIMLVTTNIITDPVRYFIGLESRAQYVVRMDPKQEAYRWIDTHPEVQGVLLVGLHDPFYLDKPALFSSCCDTPVVQTVDLDALKRNGITHIAFRPAEYERQNAAGLYSWSAAQKARFEAFLRDRCRPVARTGGVLIFRLL